MVNNKTTRWDALSMRDRASLIKLYSSQGIRSLDSMRVHYNTFGNGGARGSTKLSNTENYAVRDNTRVKGVNGIGYLPSFDSELNNRDVNIDDGVLGLVPVVGDVLQGGQALIDYFNGNYGKAALEAGMLFLPNIADKPIKQIVKGATRYLRRTPKSTIHIYDALSSPYKGTNFIHHDVQEAYIDDVLKGETRAMSPSMAVNRYGDYNELYTPGYYGEYVFLGDKSMLDNSLLFKGDAMTPTVSEIWNPSYPGASVPSSLRKDIADEIFRRTETDATNIPLRIHKDELSLLDMPTSDYYFESKYNGLLPLENFKYGLFPNPASTDNPKTAQKVIDAYKERGLDVVTYDRRINKYQGYDDKAEKLLDILDGNTDLLFASGGKIHIRPENRGKFKALLKRTGKSASWFKEHGTPAQKKMAVFALNARKWKHPDGGPLGDPDTLNSPYYNAEQEDKMYNYLKEAGLSDEVVSGIMGNIAVESYLNADMQQKGGPAYGLIQAEGSRQRDMRNFNDVPYLFGSKLTPEEQQQLDYIIEKGIKTYKPGEWGNKGFRGARDARKAFTNAKTVREASDIFTNNYLRPSKPALKRRRNMSDYFYDKYKAPDYYYLPLDFYTR